MATLKVLIDNIVEVIGPLRDFYAAKDGKFQLQLEGGHPDTAKLAEFRDHNRALQKQLRDLGELDPKEHERLKQEAAEHEAKLTAITTERDQHAADLAALTETFKDVDPVEYAALKAKPDLTTKAGELEAALASEKAAHAATAFKTAIAFDFLRIGGRPGALDYIVGKAAETFSMKDGKVTTAQFSAKTPGVALSVAEWMETQLVAADFAFASSKGGGATGGTGATAPRTRTISSDDPFEFGKNLADIASGAVIVQR